MKRLNFRYFLHEGFSNVFSHGFMSFTAIGITVACLVVMGTFSLVAYNAEVMLKNLESEYEILAFVEETYNDAQTKAVGTALEKVENVSHVQFISREEATASFEKQHEGDELLQGLDATIFRDRYAVFVSDLTMVNQTAKQVKNVQGVAKVRVDENIAGGFVTLRNVAGVICIALIAILFVVSVFIISNTIKLTTFERRDEIAIMKMVGATDSFIRWPFVYEGLLLGVVSAVAAFALQWLLYASVAKSIAISDSLKLFSVVDFGEIRNTVAISFTVAGIAIGVGGSLTAIRKFLRV